MNFSTSKNLFGTDNDGTVTKILFKNGKNDQNHEQESEEDLKVSVVNCFQHNSAVVHKNFNVRVFLDKRHTQIHARIPREWEVLYEPDAVYFGATSSVDVYVVLKSKHKYWVENLYKNMQKKAYSNVIIQFK